MKIEIENLKGLVFLKDTNDYQRALAINELNRLIDFLENKESIDWKALREKYFRECTYGNVDDLVKVGLAPHDLFEWFKKNLK